jgi:hypothetical protein
MQAVSNELSYFIHKMWSTYDDIMARHEEGPASLAAFRGECNVSMFLSLQRYSANLVDCVQDFIQNPTSSIPSIRDQAGDMLIPANMPCGFSSTLQTIRGFVRDARAIQMDYLRVGAFPGRELHNLARAMTAFAYSISADLFPRSMVHDEACDEERTPLMRRA